MLLRLCRATGAGGPAGIGKSVLVPLAAGQFDKQACCQAPTQDAALAWFAANFMGQAHPMVDAMRLQVRQ